jgi:two-component system response regulator MprA
VSATRLLVVEDDVELRGMLVKGLREEGFEVASADGGASALRRVEEVSPPDALIIDIGLPDADGRDLCQALRAQGVRKPVLFLTARDSITDKLSGFHAGGNDYLTKPFAFSELVARLEALTRRSEGESTQVGGGLRVDPVGHTITWDGRTVAATPTEFRLLSTLAAAQAQTLARRALVRAAWPDGAIVHDNTLDVYIARLRRKLASLGAAPRILTVYGVGYRLE